MAITDLEIRAIAQRIVDMSKSTARIDTEALKRSISYTIKRGVVIFRQLDYGVYDNSQLEKNAIRLMPNGTEWKMILTKFGGGITEVGRTRAGRATQRSSLRSIISSGTSKIRALIAANRAKKKAAAKKLEDG